MRVQEIDHVTFFTETVTRHLQRHFRKFNIATSQQIDENQHIVKFLIARHLDDDRAELEFLRKICQFLLKILFPPNYSNCDEFIFLLREILTCHVLFKTIDWICDPYFINHQAIVAGCVVGPTSPSPNIVNQPSHDLPPSYENGSNYKQMEKHIDKTRSKIKEYKQKLLEKSTVSKHGETVKIPSNSREEDPDQLKTVIHELECHLTRADLWRINIGAWLVDVHCVERWLETDEMLVIFLVYTDKSRTTTSTRSSSTGWIAIRTLAEVCDQKRRFSKKIPALRKLDHPIFRRSDKGQSSTPQRIWIKELQQFFDLVIGCENIADSEELFLFLSPTPRHILSKVSKLPAITPKLSKLPFLPYFGVSPILLNLASSQNSKSKASHSARDISIEQAYQNEFHLRGNPDIFFADEDEQNSDIAEPIYDLICEIFELRGVQHWLRRTVILFFQVAFGKTINKQLKDCVSFISSESFTSTYLTKFRDCFWPDGKPAEPWPEITEDDKKLTYLLAKQYLINNIPDVFVNILGQQNARKGFLKVFEALQNKKANKQLFYVSIKIDLPLKLLYNFININLILYLFRISLNHFFMNLHRSSIRTDRFTCENIKTACYCTCKCTLLLSCVITS